MEKILQLRKGNFIKINATIVFIVTILLFGGENQAFSQAAATATWNLTSSGSGSVTGSVTATSLAIGSGISNATYGATNGVTTNGWANDGGSLNSTEYYEYEVTPTAGNKLTVSSVVLNHSISNGNWIGAVYYSYDGFSTAGVQIGSNFTSSSTSQTSFSSTGLSLAVPVGGSLSIRVYAWESDGSNRNFRNRNVVITGTTCQIVSISAQPLPQNLCAGATLSFNPTYSNASGYQWYKNGTAISGATSASYSKTNIVSGDTGDYYVIASGSCGGPIVSNSVAVTVNPIPTSVTASSNLSTICTGGSVNLTSSATSNSSTRPLISQNFNGALNGWTTINNSTGGTPANAAWTLRANNYNYNNGNSYTFSSNDASQFYLSNSDAQGSGGSTATILQSPAFSTVGLSAASLTFYHHYNYYDATDYALVQVSTNGTSWTTIDSYTSDKGTVNGFVLVTLNLASYLSQPTVYIRFSYGGDYVFYWAIDNVAVTGTLTAPAASYSWTSTPALYTSSTQNPTGVAPTVNTVYNVAVTNAYGCSDSASTSSVTVNAQPIANNITPNVAAGNVCAGQSLSATFSGASGGAGTVTDVQEFSINNGGSYNPYTAAINTTSLAGQTVIIRTSRTATGTGCSTSAFKTVTWNVIAQPIANDITPNVAAGNVCAGQSLSATFSGASGGAGTVTDVQEFSINNGGSYNPYTAAINTTSLAGQTVIIRTSRTATGTGCSTSAYKTVTWNVIAQPIANNITPNVAAGNVCAGQSLSATFSGATGGAGTVTDVQEFSINNGGVYNPYTAAINTTSLAGQTVIIRTSRTATGSGCSTSAYKTVTWTIDSLSVAPTGATGTTTICSGTGTLLTVTGGSKGTGAQTKWYTGSCGGALVHTGDTLDTGILEADTTYYVSYLGTCNETSCALVTVTVTPLSTPTVSLTSSDADDDFAFGTSVTFTATEATLGGSTVSNYNFKLNGSSVQSGVSNAYTVSNLANGDQVSVDITVTGGSCLTATTATSNTITNTVTGTYYTSAINTYCGGTLPAVDAVIRCTVPTGVVGTLAYRFKVKNNITNTTVTYNSSVPNFKLTATVVYAYGTSYNVQVAPLVNGVEQPYSGSCVISTPAIPLNQVGPCTQTLTTLSDRIYATTTIFGSQLYRFRVAESTALTTYYYATSVGPNFRLTNVPGLPLNFGKTYLVSVQNDLTNNGIAVTSAYDAPCTVNTPAVTAVSVLANQCGEKLVTILDRIFINVVPNAVSYNYRVKKGVSGTEYTFNSPYTNFRLNRVEAEGLSLTYETDYYVSVQSIIRIDNVDYPSNFSTPCIIRTPDFPTVSLQASQCNDGNEENPGPYMVPSNSTLIYAEFVSGATYEFSLQEYDGENPIGDPLTSLVRPTNNFTLHQVAGVEPNKIYLVSVTLTSYGVGPIGHACVIQSPAAAREIAPIANGNMKVEFSAVAYPNPFANNFVIDVKTRNESAVSLKVYDMIGRLVEQRSVNVSDLEASPIGDDYPSGVYNVVVTQGEEVRTLRVVKR